MPYGTIHPETEAYVLMRAEQSNVSDRIKCEDPDGDFTISVIVGGALDEEFSISANGYEVNVADWIAELLTETVTDESWSVYVYPENDNTAVYRVDNYSG